MGADRLSFEGEQGEEGDVVAGVRVVWQSSFTDLFECGWLLVGYYVQPLVQDVIELQGEILFFFDFMEGPVSIRVHCFELFSLLELDILHFFV